MLKVLLIFLKIFINLIWIQIKLNFVKYIHLILSFLVEKGKPIKFSKISQSTNNEDKKTDRKLYIGNLVPGMSIQFVKF